MQIIHENIFFCLDCVSDVTVWCQSRPSLVIYEQNHDMFHDNSKTNEGIIKLGVHMYQMYVMYGGGGGGGGGGVHRAYHITVWRHIFLASLQSPIAFSFLCLQFQYSLYAADSIYGSFSLSTLSTDLLQISVFSIFSVIPLKLFIIKFSSTWRVLTSHNRWLRYPSIQFEVGNSFPSTKFLMNVCKHW